MFNLELSRRKIISNVSLDGWELLFGRVLFVRAQAKILFGKLFLVTTVKLVSLLEDGYDHDICKVPWYSFSSQMLSVTEVLHY